MSVRARTHIRSNIIGYLALFVALTIGPAWAASTAPKNSVVSKSIKNGQVKTKDIGANAVNSATVQDDSLTGADINEGTLSGLPMSGAAGGDLTGLFPNPQIAPAAVGTNKLADLAVTEQKLADHAVTGDKVAHDSLTGTNIDESTLGTVPNASSATTASSAGTASSATTADDSAQLDGFDSADFGIGLGMGYFQGLPNDGQVSGAPMGYSHAANPSSSAFVTPNHQMTIRDLAVYTNGSLGSGSRTVTLQAFGGGSIGCTITHPEITCNSGNATATIAGGSGLGITVGSSGVTNGDSITFGWRATGSP